MTKEQLAQSIIVLENELNAIRGKEQIDPNSVNRIIYNYTTKNDKPSLEKRLDDLQKAISREKAEKETKEKVDAFYATLEGAAMKAELENERTNLISDWHAHKEQTSSAIEARLQEALGNHWGVKRYNKGYLAIAVIDGGKSTPEIRDYHFGQDIEIRYDERWGEPTFQSNCGSCGSFDMEGGNTVGERAMFYVGIGKLYGNTELVDFLKKTMMDSAKIIDRFSKECNALDEKIKNPLA